MGYKDDLYNKNNIIGYTGILDKDPTVYFVDCGDVNQKFHNFESRQRYLVQHGHITQMYHNIKNIGRERVEASATYSIYNRVDEDGNMRLVECLHGSEIRIDHNLEEDADGNYIFHQSRNHFVHKNSGNIDILALAIERYPYVKAMYDDLYRIRGQSHKLVSQPKKNKFVSQIIADEFEFEWDDWHKWDYDVNRE